jgi:hypothetical protein
VAFFNEVAAFAKRHEGDAAMAPYAAPLAQGLGDLQQATMWFMQNAMAKPDNAGAGSTDYMHLFGLVALGWMWGLIAEAAHAKKASDPSAAAAMDAKLAVGRFYMERIMPETALRLARIRTGADVMMSLPEEAF